MAFILFMTGFALILALILWLFFRQKKSRPSKKRKPSPKKIPQRKKGGIDSKSAPTPVSSEEMRNNATELLKKNPEVVSQVVKQWLRDQ